MPSLSDHLNDDEKRRRIVDDACHVLEEEVSDKSGLSGAAIKTSFKVLKGLKPGIVPQAVNDLLDDFIAALDPLYQEALEQGVKPSDHIRQHGGRMADALLQITDVRAEKSQNSVVKKTYDRLRPTAKKHVEAAAPRIGLLIERHSG